MKRAATVVFVVFVAFFALVFSTVFGLKSNNNTDNSTKKDTVKLTFINSWGGYDAKANCLDGLLDSFSKSNKDIEVINKSISGDDFLPTLKEKFASGDQPDVFGLWPGSDIRMLISAGKVADLTDLLDKDNKWENSFDEKNWSLVRQNGKIYGIPVEMTFEGLYINKDLFNKYKVEIPKNYDDLLDAVKIFRKNGITPIAFNCKPEGSYLYQNIAMSLGGKNIEHPFTDDKIDPCYIKAMYVMRDLFNLGAFPKNSECFTMESNARDDLFLNGKAAMIVQGSWFAGKCKDKNIVIVQFPKMSAQSQNNMVYGLGCGSFYISQKSYKDPQKREACIKLLKFLTSRNASVRLAQQTDMISNVDIRSYNIKYSDLTNNGIELKNSANILVGPPDSYINRNVWEDVIVADFPDMLSDRISPEDLWKKAIEDGAEEGQNSD